MGGGETEKKFSPFFLSASLSSFRTAKSIATLGTRWVQSDDTGNIFKEFEVRPVVSELDGWRERGANGAVVNVESFCFCFPSSTHFADNLLQ